MLSALYILHHLTYHYITLLSPLSTFYHKPIIYISYYYRPKILDYYHVLSPFSFDYYCHSLLWLLPFINVFITITIIFTVFIIIQLCLHNMMAFRNKSFIVRLLYNIAISGWRFGTWILFSPIVGMMIQSDFHIFQGGRCTTNLVRYLLISVPIFPHDNYFLWFMQFLTLPYCHINIINII